MVRLFFCSVKSDGCGGGEIGRHAGQAATLRFGRGGKQEVVKLGMHEMLPLPRAERG